VISNSPANFAAVIQPILSKATSSLRPSARPKKFTPEPLNHSLTCDICSVVRDKFFMRNNEDKDVQGLRRVPRDGFRVWIKRTPVPFGRQVSIISRLLRSARLLPCQVGKSSALARFILERWDHMRWWAYGAFGSKGRLEGGQYRAGRRAPPLLHRQPKRLSGAGGQVCRLRSFRTS
jgi:hypothetical protein